MSGCLTEAGVDHVILERHDVGHSWRRERWDSLRTLTPNWMNGLPRLPYRGPDPDGFMTAAEVADLVVALRRLDRRPRGDRDRGVGDPVRWPRSRRRGRHGSWVADAVVLATGPGRVQGPRGGGGAARAASSQVCAVDYRNPAQLAATAS